MKGALNAALIRIVLPIRFWTRKSTTAETMSCSDESEQRKQYIYHSMKSRHVAEKIHNSIYSPVILPNETRSSHSPQIPRDTTTRELRRFESCLLNHSNTSTSRFPRVPTHAAQSRSRIMSPNSASAPRPTVPDFRTLFSA